MIDGLRCKNYGAAAVDRLRGLGILKLRSIDKAKYKGLTFEIEQDKYEMFGSIHKYFNDGLHNANDFTIDEYREALIRLSHEFGINPQIIPFTSTEFGVNIVLPCDAKKFLKSLVMYRDSKTKPITTDKYGGLEVRFDEYKIKIYIKSSQYPKYTQPNTLRFEVVVNKTRRLENQIIDDPALRLETKGTSVVRMLSDNADKKVWRCYGRELLRCLDRLVINDVDAETLLNERKITKIDAKLLTDGKDYEYWDKMPKEQRKREFDRFNDLLIEHSTIKNIVRQLLSEKIELVTKSQYETFEDYAKNNVTKSQVYVTKSQVYESAEIDGNTKNNVTKSHVVKGGFGDTPKQENNIEKVTQKKERATTKKSEEKKSCRLVSDLLKEVREYTEQQERESKNKVRCERLEKYLIEYLRGIEYVESRYYDAAIDYMKSDIVVSRLYENCLIKNIAERELAQKIGCAYEVLRRVSGMGHTGNNKLSFDLLQRCADGLGVPVWELFHASKRNAA